MALKLFREAELRVISNEKQPGFTLITEADYCEQMNLIVHGPAYRKAHRWEVSESGIRKHLLELSKKVAVFYGCDHISGVLTRLWLETGYTLESELISTCKTHKPAGAVNFRNIHAALRNRWRGLGDWIARCSINDSGRSRTSISMCPSSPAELDSSSSAVRTVSSGLT